MTEHASHDATFPHAFGPVPVIIFDGAICEHRRNSESELLRNQVEPDLARIELHTTVFKIEIVH